MRSLRLSALLAATLLVACSDDDAAPSPVADTGSVGEETSSDTGVVETDSGADSTPDDATVDSATDTGGGDAEAGSDTAAADGAEAGGKACSFASGGCSASEYCDMPTCDTGTCKPRPTTAAKGYDPVCGCDGVTYWNASTAEVTGHGYKPGKCDLADSTTRFCGIKDCDAAEECIADLTDKGMCALGGFGKTCWRLPAGATCPSGASDTPKVRECSGGSAGSCNGYCKAILNEVAGTGVTGFFADGTCP